MKYRIIRVTQITGVTRYYPEILREYNFYFFTYKVWDRKQCAGFLSKEEAKASITVCDNGIIVEEGEL